MAVQAPQTNASRKVGQTTHPIVQRVLERQARGDVLKAPDILDATWLRELCLECGADDVGFVSLERPEFDKERADIVGSFPHAKSVISFVCKMNRESVRSPARSLANNEFHETGDHVTMTSRLIARRLEGIGVRAMNEPVAFPMEADRFPKPWLLSLKPLAVAAGLGQMGLHRNVIHPKFGNFILLGAVLVDRPIGSESQPIDFNPCFECKLCVAVCPVGAISPDGHFNFNSCITHNYREFLGGFTDWVEIIANSKNALEYRRKVSDNETISMWQSLTGRANYKAAYCMAVCPAGEDVIRPFLENRKDCLKTTLKPLQEKEETLYVVAGTDAESCAAKRYPHKTLKRVKNGIRLQSIKSFLGNVAHVFQREQSKGLDAAYHFTFTGKEQAKATIVIREGTIRVEDGHLGKADLSITASSETWVKFLAKERNIVIALLTRRIRVKGLLKLLVAFGNCFPSS